MSTIHLANQPSYSELLKHLHLDSAPALYPSVLRLWSSIHFEQQDIGLRLLGFILTLVTLGIIWTNVQSLTSCPPILTLTLLGCHGIVLDTLGSIKPYGLGLVFILLAINAFWKVITSERLSTFFYATAISILAVQTLYQNAVFVFILAVAAISVKCFTRNWKGAIRIALVGFLTVLSLLPYIGILKESQEWRHLNTIDLNTEVLLTSISTLFSHRNSRLLIIWVVIIVGGLFAAIRIFFMAPRTRYLSPQKALMLYVLLAMSGGIVGYILFLKMAGRMVQPWHAALLLALVAYCLEVIYAQTLILRWCRLGIAFLTVIILIPNSLSYVSYRRTNIDLIAHYLEKVANKDDFIIVNPWFCGITFKQYYRGDTGWTTVPPIKDLSIHRYDLFKEQMMLSEPLNPILSAIEKTLKRGNSVWFVDNLNFLSQNNDLSKLPLIPKSKMVPEDVAYSMIWTVQVSHYIRNHSTHTEKVLLPLNQEINFEKLEISMLRGWHGS